MQQICGYYLAVFSMLQNEKHKSTYSRSWCVPNLLAPIILCFVFRVKKSTSPIQQYAVFHVTNLQTPFSSLLFSVVQNHKPHLAVCCFPWYKCTSPIQQYVVFHSTNLQTQSNSMLFFMLQFYQPHSSVCCFRCCKTKFLIQQYAVSDVTNLISPFSSMLFPCYTSTSPIQPPTERCHCYRTASGIQLYAVCSMLQIYKHLTVFYFQDDKDYLKHASFAVTKLQALLTIYCRRTRCCRRGHDSTNFENMLDFFQYNKSTSPTELSKQALV